MTSKLQKNTSFFTEYDKIIKNYIKEGIIEPIPTHGAPCEIHCLPHRAVVCENKDTTKVRIVSDTSSKVRDEPSLNGSLHLDPCLSPAIYNILLRFCLGKVGLVSDVKQVFLNIVIGEKHRDLLRFLWYLNFDVDDSEVIILRCTQVVFGLRNRPFLLNDSVKKVIT